MKIGIDLDHVLFNNTIVADVLKEMDIHLDVLYWDFSNVSSEVKKKCFEKFLDIDYVCNLKPIKGTKTKIKKWHNAGHELVCVTARPFEQFDRTQDMLTTHFPEIDQLVVVGHNGLQFTKLEAYKKYNFDCIIDDCVENIQDALTVGIEHIYLVSNKDTIWNKYHDFHTNNKVKIVEGVKNIDI